MTSFFPSNPSTEYLILLLGIIAFALLFKKMSGGFGANNLKVFGITLISLVIAILAVSDIDGNKLSAAFGILGAIVGYLFGLSRKQHDA